MESRLKTSASLECCLYKSQSTTQFLFWDPPTVIDSTPCWSISCQCCTSWSRRAKNLMIVPTKKYWRELKPCKLTMASKYCCKSFYNDCLPPFFPHTQCQLVIPKVMSIMSWAMKMPLSVLGKDRLLSMLRAHLPRTKPHVISLQDKMQCSLCLVSFCTYFLQGDIQRCT